MSKFTYYYIKYVLIPCVLLLSITLFFSFTSHGASQTVGRLPVVIDNIDVSPYQDYINRNFGGFWNLSTDYVIGWGIQRNGYYEQNFAMVQDSSQIFNYFSVSPVSISSSYPNYDYYSNSIQLTFSNLANNNNKPWRLVTFYSNTTGPGYPYGQAWNVTSTINVYCYGNTGLSINYISCPIPFTSSGTAELDKMIFSDEESILIPEGYDPSAPDFSNLDLDSNLNTSSVPTPPTYSNNFNDPLPTWDSTAPFESLFDIILWGFNRIHSIFQSFREYLFSWLGYFINLLTYLIQKIINAIKYIVSWLYDQFLNWLNPYLKIWSFISGLLFNEDEQLSIFDVLFNLLNFFITWCGSFWSNSWFSDFFTNLVSSYQTIQGYFEDLQSFFSKVVLFFTTLVALGTVNGEFSFPVLFQTLFLPSADSISFLLLNHDVYGVVPLCENMVTLITNYKLQLTPSSTDDYKIVISSFQLCGQTIDQMEIDFSWYLDFKNYGDPIISAFLVFGYFMWLHSRFPYWLRGQQGDISKATQEISK